MKHVLALGLAAASVLVTAGMAAAPAAYAGPATDQNASVVSIEREADGTVIETTYTPAPDITTTDLAGRLTASGAPNVSIRREGDVSAQAAACSLGTARTWPSSATCFVRWSKNGAVRPVIDFVDHSSSKWPVGRAVTEWNKTSGIDSIYRPASSGCDGAPTHCVSVTSGNYGDTGWVGLTSRSLNSAQTYYTSANVKLNDYYGGTEAEHWNGACHELGHVLGLDHNTSTGSCLYYVRTSQKYPHADDRKLLERYY